MFDDDPDDPDHDDPDHDDPDHDDPDHDDNENDCRLYRCLLSLRSSESVRLFNGLACRFLLPVSELGAATGSGSFFSLYKI